MKIIAQSQVVPKPIYVHLAYVSAENAVIGLLGLAMLLAAVIGLFGIMKAVRGRKKPPTDENDRPAPKD
jgi:hypothetical protein